MEEVTAEKLQTALDAREKSAFIAHINNCKDFNLVFDFTIQCAKLAHKTTRFFSPFEKDKLEDMMACGLQRMLTLQPYSWDMALAVSGRKPDPLIICVQVIEGYFFSTHSAREGLLKFRTEKSFTLGYVLWKCCPNMIDSRRFPEIYKFFSTYINRYISDSRHELASNKYHFFFDILSIGIRRKLIADDFVLENYSGYGNALFQYWCNVRPGVKTAARILLSKRLLSVSVVRDIRILIARHIIREGRAMMDGADLYGKIAGISIPAGLRMICGKNNNDNAALVRILLDADPSAVNKTDPFGTTPLHFAVGAGNIGIVRVLLKNGAKITPKEKEAANINPEIFALLEKTEKERAEKAKRKQEATSLLALGKYKRGIFASEELRQLPPDAMRLIGRMVKASSSAAA